jgi:hypothetical protein
MVDPFQEGENRTKEKDGEKPVNRPPYCNFNAGSTCRSDCQPNDISVNQQNNQPAQKEY